MNDTASCWWWTAEPARCWDRTGHDLAVVAPGAQVRGRHWWACDRATRTGDRAVISVAGGPTTISYLVEVTSDAREPRPWELSERLTLYVCDYVVRERVEGDPVEAWARVRDAHRPGLLVRAPGPVAGVMAG